MSHGDYQDYQQWRLEVECVTRCADCDWTTIGGVLDNHEAFRKHLWAAHRKRIPRPKRRGSTQWSPMAIGKMQAVEDNVKAAREEGAATWVTKLG